MTPIDSLEPLQEFVREQQVIEWNRLDDALRNAINGVWSMDCEARVERIRAAALLVGPTHWSEVPWLLVRSQIYTWILAHGEIEDFEVPNRRQMRETNVVMRQHFDPDRLPWLRKSRRELVRYDERNGYAGADPATPEG